MLNQILPPQDFKFHHIGYATSSIEQERNTFLALGYELEGKPFIDNSQGVAGCFIKGPGPRIELLENLPNSDTLTPWLSAGIKMYHFAYCVDSLGGAIEWAKARRAMLVVLPVPAIAFDGRKIAFVMLRSGLLVEFIESE